MNIVNVIILVVLLLHVKLLGAILEVPKSNEDSIKLLKQLLFELDEPKDCVFAQSSDKDIPYSTTTGSLYQYIPIITTNNDEFSQEILNAMNQGCSTFLIVPNSISKALPILYNTSVSSLQRKLRRYFILHEGNVEDVIPLFQLQLTKFLPHVYVLVSSEGNNTARNSKLYQILSQMYGKNLQPQGMKVIGTWKGNISKFEGKIKKDILQGQHLKLLLTSYSPYVMVEEDFVDGTEYRVLIEFSKRYNFTWDLDIMNGTLGDISDDEFSNSYFGRLKSLKYQTGAPAVFITESSLNYFDIVAPHSLFGIGFLTPVPKQLHYLWNIFTPFKFSTWSCVSGFILFCSLNFLFFTFLETRLYNFVMKSQYNQFGYALLNSMLLSVGQSISDEDRTVMKHLIVWFSITSTLFITAYNSNLVSFLTTPQLETPIDTLTQFIDSGLSWGLNDMVYLEILDGEEHSQMKVIGSRNKYFEDTDMLNNEARNGRIAVVFEKLFSGYICGADFLEEDTLTQLHAMKESLVNFYLAFAFQKGSPLIQIFDKFVSHLRDSGIYIQWEKEMVDMHRSHKFMLPLRLHANAFHPLVPLSIAHITGIFILFMVGHCLALIAFIYEKCIHVRFSTKNQLIYFQMKARQKVKKKHKRLYPFAN